jgi:hypothetical protein
MHEYIARRQPNKSCMLVKDGNVCLCPKTTVALPHQVAMTHQVGLIPTQMPCTTNCPFAEVLEVDNAIEQENGGSTIDGKKLQYVIQCEGREKRIDLKSIEEQEEKQKEPRSNILRPIGEA